MRHSSNRHPLLLHRHHTPRKDVKMTTGPLFGKIIAFSIPIIFTNLLQVLFNATDMMVVSLSTEANSVGAIGTTSAMISTILTLFIGIAGGVTVVVAQRLGAGDGEATERAVHTAVAMALPFGFAAMATLMCIAEPLLRLLGDTGDVLRLAVLYTRIYAAGLPLASLLNFVNGVFNAKGDSRTPLFVMTAAGALNVALNLFFVLVCKMSVDGVAIATVVSNGLAAVTLLFFLKKSDGPCRFYFKKLAFHKKAFKEILYNGVPNAVQGSLFGISNMMILSSVMQVNNAVMASLPAENAFQPVANGNVVAGNIEGFAYTTVHSVAQASLPFAGQNEGAGEHRRAARVLWTALLFAGALGMLIGWAAILFRTPLFALYGVRNIEGVQAIAFEAATIRMKVMLTFYFTAAMMEVGGAVLRGIGKPLASAGIVFSGVCVLRVVWMKTIFRYYFATHADAPLNALASIYISYPVSWALAGTLLCAVSLLTLRRRARKGAAEKTE